MGQPIRHIVSGVEVTIDSASVIDLRNIWVDLDELPEALRQIKKLSQTHSYRPEVYAAGDDASIADRKVCIRLQE